MIDVKAFICETRKRKGKCKTGEWEQVHVKGRGRKGGRERERRRAGGRERGWVEV